MTPIGDLISFNKDGRKFRGDWRLICVREGIASISVGSVAMKGDICVLLQYWSWKGHLDSLEREIYVPSRLEICSTSNSGRSDNVVV
jgi:hypothetical protein